MRDTAPTVAPGDLVLVVSADTELRARYLNCLCVAGLRPRGATSGMEALPLMALHRFDGVIADADLVDMRCERLVEEVRADPDHADAAFAVAGRSAPVLVIAALADALAARASQRLASMVAAIGRETSGFARNTA